MDKRQNDKMFQQRTFLHCYFNGRPKEKRLASPIFFMDQVGRACTKMIVQPICNGKHKK